MPEEQTSQSPAPYRVQRDEDFVSLYANNVAFENSIWDLKIIFGQLDIAEQKIEFHTAVAVPWMQAKIMSYYLQAHVTLYESEHGKIRIPSAIHPPPPQPLPEELKSDPTAQAARVFIEKLREDLISPK